MLTWWGKAVSTARWYVLGVAALFIAFAAWWGTGAFDRLADDSSLADPASESQRIGDRISDELGRQGVHLIALYSSDSHHVDDPEFRSAVEEATARLRAHDFVESMTTYYQTQAPELVAEDGQATYVPIRFVSGTDERTLRQVPGLVAADGLDTQVGGPVAVNIDIDKQVSEDILRAELIAMPLLLILLLIIFGSVVAASTPLLIGTFAILGAFTAVRLLTMVTDVSVLSISLITILGLGLAVDYALFMVSRFREELDRGQTVEAAVARTVATAGRTVAVSAAVVAMALSTLLIFPGLLLRSMGMGGAAAVIVAMLASLTVLPALLAVLGHRIDAVRLPWARRRGAPSVTGALAARQGAWGRIAHSVMRRPVLYATGSVAVLLVLAVPFLRVEFGGIDERVLPEGTESRVVSERLAAGFGVNADDPIRVLVSGASPADAAEFAARVDALSGVRDTQLVAERDHSTLLTVSYTGESDSAQARDTVRDIRALDPPAGAEVLVGGPSAEVVDQLDGLGSRLPWMVLLIAGVTFLMLTVAFGSVVVPLKAILMNVVSIGAAFGVVVWIFQDGHLSGLLGFTPTGHVEASQPILMLAILFGLSMDYEVFLLSRVRESWDRLGDNTAAVVDGVQRTGGIITAAALLLCVVIGGFATSGITFIKMVGVGLLVALVLDATVVRLLLVPATMRLLGRHNWWAPAFVQRLYYRYGHRESESESEPETQGPGADPRAGAKPAVTTAGAAPR